MEEAVDAVDVVVVQADPQHAAPDEAGTLHSAAPGAAQSDDGGDGFAVDNDCCRTFC